MSNFKNITINSNITCSDVNVGGILHITNTSQSTDSITGALIIDGGIGIKKDLYVGGNLDISGSFDFPIAEITSTDDSTSTSSGALVVGGGVGIAKDLYVGGNINSYNDNALIRSSFSNKTLGVQAVSTWTSRTTTLDSNWYDICWSPELGLLCAVSNSTSGYRIMVSTDGINWIIVITQTSNEWTSVCWSPELKLFCIVASGGSFSYVVTSTDGMQWTERTAATNSS
jgi:hypothetical protein